jgi:ubiquinone/menaquinone biosynthesis C-methylase UbiE
MVAVTSWKISQLEKVMESRNCMELLGIQDRINIMPDSNELQVFEQILDEGKPVNFKIGKTVCLVGDNLKLVYHVTPANSIDSLVASLSL